MLVKNEKWRDWLKSLFTSDRFAPVWHLAGLYLLLTTALRLGLTLLTATEAELTFAPVARIFLVGLFYDLVFLCYASTAAVCFLAVLPERLLKNRWWRRLSTTTFFLVIYGILFVTLAEGFFWAEFQARFNFIAVDYLIYTNEVVANIVESYPLFTLLSLMGTLAGMLTYAHVKQRQHCLSGDRSPGGRWLTPMALLILCGIFTASVGQSLRTGPDNNFVRELASNGPYQFFAAFRNNTLDYRQFYRLGDDAALSTRLKKLVATPAVPLATAGLYDIDRQVNAAPAERPLNVILVTVESLSARYLTRFGSTENYTPCLDALAKEGMLFTNFYATGTRTVRGLEALTLSLPPTPGRSTIKRPQIPVYYSLGRVFQSHGYDTAFIYGGHGVFDNMNAFFAKQGYRIVDQGDFASGEITFANAWGVCDGDLFGKTIREADKQDGKPFFFHLMTTSNHRPYTFPEGTIDFPQKHRSSAIRYTDYAIGQFIEASRNKPWFKDTIFVVVADHCASSAGRAALNLPKYHIPLLIYSPSHIAPKEVATLSSQIDVAPTLLSLLGLSYHAGFFGGDILEPDFHQRALMGTYQKLGLLENGRLLVLEPSLRSTILTPPWENPDTVPAAPEDPLLYDAEAYYQGADYTLRHHLNSIEKR
jgi:phosphoglycerol transferase MdoB-like AlkP superfamily enzyme